MRRRVASPDADTPSYCPPFMSVTISSEEPATLLLTLQPVAFVNGVTQSGSPDLLPPMAWPAQRTRSPSPSPAPTDFWTGTEGGAGCPAPADPPPDVLLPP